MREAGEEVYVREDLEVNVNYGDNTFVKEMIRYKGKKLTIVEYVGDAGYSVEENCWNWTEEMFTDGKPILIEAREIYERGEKNDEAIQDIAEEIGFKLMNYFGAEINYKEEI